jgi:sensor histidine kinase YesM
LCGEAIGADRAVRRAIAFLAQARVALGGLTLKGVGLLALLALLNALRRNSYLFTDADAATPLFWQVVKVSEAFATGFILALLVAVAVVTAYDCVPRGTRWHYPALLVGLLASTALGVVLTLTASVAQGEAGWTLQDMLGMWPRYFLVGMLGTAVYLYFRHAKQSADHAYQAEQERQVMQQQMDEARLLMLQAQIEPHFLFNTLATVRSLYQSDPTAAAAMLDNLMRYLGAALPHMRASDSTLMREMTLTTAYLHIQRIRMGRRLTFEIDMDSAIENARMPPMMLLTLTENAIKHGLAPLPEGGSLRIRARREGDLLRVQVIDSGKGFTPLAGAGTGLANIAARLAAGYGEKAQLMFAPNSPRGATATIALPFSTAT